ncbi:MAG: excalibur calcium-binding domain-containing protein [Sphingobium sp.]|uniref:excalibur calcium-binding domain-containing protein n=1 Tax=Sphingobium sp. TaxID=1912891 RepID=UPI003BAF3B3C
MIASALIAATPAWAQDCLSDAEIDAALGAQVRAGAFFVSTRSLPDKPLCSGLTLAQQIQRMRAAAFPEEAERAAEAKRAMMARAAVVQAVPVEDQEAAEEAVPVPVPVPATPVARAPRYRKAARARSAPAPARQAARSFYGSCREARAAGAAPLRRGQAGYARHLDRDGDGVACE